MDQMDSVTSAVSALSLASKPSSRNGKIAWPGGPAERQNFSVLEKILYYMARNPKSPEGYLKLAMSCKYFFEQMPLLVVSCIRDNGKILCSTDREYDCDDKNHTCCINVDLAKLTSNLWVTHEVRLSQPHDPNLASILLPKIYECKSYVVLYLMRIELTLEELKVWATTFRAFEIFDTKVTDNDGSTLMVDKILESLPDIYEFSYVFNVNTPAATASSMKNILKLKNLDKLKNFSLMCIPEDIAVEDLSDFMTKHKDVAMLLDFAQNLSDAYKAQLDALIDDVIVSEVRDRIIWYPGGDKEKLDIMKSRSDSYMI